MPLQDEYKDAPGAVITADFYNASALLPLSDEAVVERVQSHLETCEPGFKGARSNPTKRNRITTLRDCPCPSQATSLPKQRDRAFFNIEPIYVLGYRHLQCPCCAAGAQVVDSVVLRFPKAVTHFSPGSYQHRPRQATSIANVFLAGDYVKDVPHGAYGLSQVSAGLQCKRAGLLECTTSKDVCTFAVVMTTGFIKCVGQWFLLLLSDAVPRSMSSNRVRAI